VQTGALKGGWGTVRNGTTEGFGGLHMKGWLESYYLTVQPAC
jgi:hypothetical protein